MYSVYTTRIYVTTMFKLTLSGARLVILGDNSMGKHSAADPDQVATYRIRIQQNRSYSKNVDPDLVL